MKYIRNILLFSLLSLCFSAPGYSSGYDKPLSGQYKITTGISYAYGYMLNQINNSNSSSSVVTSNAPYMGQSRFTINCPVAEINFYILNFEIFNQQLKLQFQLQKNIPLVNEKMEDSKWGLWYSSGYPWADYYTLDSSAKGDAVLDLWKIKLMAMKTSYVFKNVVEWQFGLEYKYYHYDMINSDQIYPSYDRYKNFLSGDKSGHSYQNSLVRTYTAYILPSFFGFSVSCNRDPFIFQTGLQGTVGPGYSMNEDLQLNRKTSAKLLVLGIRGNFGLDWEFSNNWSAGFLFQAEIFRAAADMNESDSEVSYSLSQGLETLDVVYVSGGLFIGYSF